jgi:hypothetical protein
MKTQLKNHVFKAAFVCALLCSQALHAANYHVNIITGSLVGSASAPFYLDFQFSSGSGLDPYVGNNTISLSNFTFTGGSATGSSSTSGIASGSLATSVSLMDSITPSEFYQGFTSTTTQIGFDVVSTLNLDAGLTPDQFSTAILDSSLGSPAQIYTTSPDTLSLATEVIDSATILNIHTYNGDGPADGSAPGSFSGVVASVPEPSSFGLLSFGLLGMLYIVRRRRALA